MIDDDSKVRRLLGVQPWPKVLLAGACLILLASLALVLARFSYRSGGLRSAAVPARAERAVARQFFLPPVPDDRNFAATPFLAVLFDKSIQVGASQWPDDFSRADSWPRHFPTLAESPGGQQSGRLVTDLAAWQKAFDLIRFGPKRDVIEVMDAVDPSTNALAATAVLEALKPYEPALNELRAASQRPDCRYHVRYDEENPWAILLPHLAVVKRTCQLLRLKACAELAADHAEQALGDTGLMLHLIGSIQNEPFLISQLVRVACLNLAWQPIWEGLAGRRWSEVQLQSLQARLQQFDSLADLKRVLEAERAWGNLTIGLVRDKRTPHFLSSLMSSGGGVEPWLTEADRVLTTCPREWFDEEQRNYNQLFDERLLAGFDPETRRVSPRVTIENAHFVEKTLKNKGTLLKNHLVFARALLVAPSKIHLKLANAQGLTDLAAVACALERWRLANSSYPNALPVLTPRFLQKIPDDLVSGEPLHYQKLEDGQFLLYSVGWNEVDDGGEIAFLASGQGTEIQEGDWVWRYPSKKEEVRRKK
jgi:hypothetical protein